MSDANPYQKQMLLLRRENKALRARLAEMTSQFIKAGNAAVALCTGGKACDACKKTRVAIAAAKGEPR